MTAIRQRIEALFERISYLVFDHRWLAMTLMVVVTVPPLLLLPTMTIDTRTESLFLKGDPAIADYDAFRRQFGIDDFIVVAVEPPEVFSFEALSTLRELHNELAASVPYVADVTSLINARNTRGEGDTLIVEELLEHWPESRQELTELRRRVLSNPLYVNNLISEDGTVTTIVIKGLAVRPVADADPLAGFDEAGFDETGLNETGFNEAGFNEAGEPPPPAAVHDADEFLSSDQYTEMYDAVRAITDRYDRPDFPIHLAGGPVITAVLTRAVPQDMARLLPLSTLLIVVILLLLFRRLSGVVYPLLIVWLALLATLGVMAGLHIPMTNFTSMLTSFLLVVGIADAVHILSRFYQRYQDHGDRRRAMAEALAHSGLAVLMTSVTTATGLLSFVTADVAPIADLGIVAPIGIGFALLYTVVLLPALVAIIPVRRRSAHPARRTAAMDRLLAWVSSVACTNSIKIVIIGALVAVISVAGMSRLRFSQNGLKWFKKNAEVRRSAELVDRKLKGSLANEVILDTGETNGLWSPDLLNRLDQAAADLEGKRDGKVFIGKVQSLDTIVKEINRALHENREEFYTIPQDRSLVAQELLLFEGSGSDDLEELVDRDLRQVRCTLKVPFEDAFHQVGLLATVTDYFTTHFPDTTVTVTGANPLFVKMFQNIIRTMAKSYLFSLSIITVLMMLLIGRVRIGMLSMVPNLLPLMAILGIMGWLDIALDMSTVLIGSIAIGLVVDDTIHFMHNFRRYLEQTGDLQRSVDLTLATAGRAILVTSIVLAGGFYVSITSEMASTVVYGSLVGTTVVLALIADFFLTPALMALVHRGQRSPAPKAPGELPKEVSP